MSLFNPNYLPQGLILAGSLSLFAGTARAQTAETDPPQGRAGIATLCIEKRAYVDYDTKKIVVPTIYIDAMPKEGIDTGYVKGGPVEAKWKEFLNPTDPTRKQWLADTDIPDQANAALELLARLDRDKVDGIVTPEEFEKGEKGKSEEDKKTDLAFLTSLRCDSLYLTQGALNTVDVNAFPEVITLNSDLDAANATIDAANVTIDVTRREKEDAEKRADGFMLSTIVLAAFVGVGLAVGGTLLYRSRRKPKPEGDQQPPKMPEPPKPEAAAKDAPEPEKIKLVKGKPAEKAAALEEDDMNDVLRDIEAAKDDASGPKPAPGEKKDEKADAAPPKPSTAADDQKAKPVDTSNAVTAANLIIEGDGAAPVKGVDEKVIRAQIAALYPPLTETAHRREFDELADRLIAAYWSEFKISGAMEGFWSEEASHGLPIVRRGLPASLITSVAFSYLRPKDGAALLPKDLLDRLFTYSTELIANKDGAYKKELLETFSAASS